MNDTLKNLIESWKLVKSDGNIFAEIDKTHIANYINDLKLNKRKNIHFIFENLVPFPWWGNIENPKIVFLVLNPKYEKDGRDRLEQELKSKTNASFLNNLNGNPTINWLKVNPNTVSEKWWFDTFKGIISINSLNQEDLDKIANNIGVFELFGYYSSSMGSYESLDQLIKNEFGSQDTTELPTQKVLFNHLKYLINQKNPPLFVIIWGQKYWREKLPELDKIDYIDTINTASHCLSEKNLRKIDYYRLKKTLFD